ncbi:hypothetical protein Val02_71610 [Virgisporangium aliadipatigenens]|uniref:DUF559 domain-containing protein n=1 Tax=Virgisporangium aliadipatigenens TaxID=741659 RepID=A0A8J4DTK1_9ACTN|nr:hypothetical protein Val02_71610 [Virgisporangium aliadipatigenens]
MLLDGGLPRPLTQHEVRDRCGALVARLDLAYEAQRVGVEYEGAHHRERDAFQRDLRPRRHLSHTRALRLAECRDGQGGPGALSSGDDLAVADAEGTGARLVRGVPRALLSARRARLRALGVNASPAAERCAREHTVAPTADARK